MPRFTSKLRNPRRMGRDQEESMEALREDLKECLDDPDSDYGDLHAVLASHFPEEASQVHREISQDARGVHGWAKDRRERRRLTRDVGPGPAMEPAGRPVEEFRPENRPNENMRGANDARAMAMDAQHYRRPSLAGFHRRFPNARNIESL
jgi:hypothetical protein